MPVARFEIPFVPWVAHPLICSPHLCHGQPRELHPGQQNLQLNTTLLQSATLTDRPTGRADRSYVFTLDRTTAQRIATAEVPLELRHRGSALLLSHASKCNLLADLPTIASNLLHPTT